MGFEPDRQIRCFFLACVILNKMLTDSINCLFCFLWKKKGWLQSIVLCALVLALIGCSNWDASRVRIERFEYLDGYSGKPYVAANLVGETYLIDGYSKRHEEGVLGITDKYVCDSILPNIDTLYRSLSIAFFRKTKNTNLENFQGRIKNKSIKAWSEDLLFTYYLVAGDSGIHSMLKIVHRLDEPVNESGPFLCD